MATKAFLEKAYLAYFGRPVDPTGLTDYAASTDTQVADAFAASAESKALYGTTFNYAQINAIYLALFNREAEKEGLEYWYAKVADKTFTPAGAALAILNGALNADKIAVENKLAASAAFTAALDTASEMIGYSGDAAATSARSFLSTVTATAATAAAVDAAVVAAVAAKTAVPAQTFTLTTSIDTFTGTAGDDAFLAVNGSTLSVADTLAGGSGSDTLTITDTTGGVIPALTLSSIENITVRTTVAEDGTDESLAMTNYTGVALVTLDRITDNFNITDLSVATVVKVVNNVGTAVDVNLDYASVTGAADSATVQVDKFDASSDLFIDAGIETLTISSVGTSASTIAALDVEAVATLNLAGTASALTITEADAGANDATKTINVTGANKVTVTNALSTAVTKIDASAATGGSTFTLAGLTSPVFTGGSGVDTVTAIVSSATVKGGAGNDVITLGATVLGVTGLLDGGDGTDTLVISDDTTTVFTTATKALISSFETLRIATVATSNDGQVVDFDSETGFTALEIGDNDDLTVNDIATSVLAAGVNVLAANTGSLVLNATDATVPGTADTLKLNLDHTTADTAVTIVDLQAAGVETLTVISAGAGTNTNSIELGTENTVLANINISGASKFTLTTQGAADVGGVLVVNGADATGVLTITLTGEDDGSSITTGSGADAITGGTAVDVISSGAGADTLTISGGNDRYTGGSGIDNYKFAAPYDDGDDAITISDFLAGIDGDLISFDVSTMDGATADLIDNLDMDAYIEGTVAVAGTNTSSTAFASNKINVITDLSFATFTAAETELEVEAGAALTDIAVVFLNSTTGYAELWVTDTTADATVNYKAVTFTGITTLEGIAALAANNFTDF